MKITVINGFEKRGVTYRMKELFLENLKDNAEITEFYLPKDGPGFCTGCLACFYTEEEKCKDRECVAKIENAMLEADLLVFASPVYVFHTTGAMKALLDHFAFRWMVHRPTKEMFGKRAVIITQSLGGGVKSAAKDIKDSLSWWGISDIRVITLRLMTEVDWNKIPEKRKAGFAKRLYKEADKIKNIDFTKPARASLVTKCKFYIVRMMQTGLGKTNSEYTDYKYWKQNGWIDNVRPWK